MQMDLFASPPPPKWEPLPVAKPLWRDGVAIPGSDKGYTPTHEGDLRFLWHRRGAGRWFRWDQRDMNWVCLDPHDATGINLHPDTPPAQNKLDRKEVSKP